MVKQKFEIGDILRIRQWDDMADEFGIIGDTIECKFGFTPAMRYLCGQKFTVKEIYDGEFQSEEGIENDTHSDDYWSISEDMLEMVEPTCELKINDIKKFNEMLIS